MSQLQRVTIATSQISGQSIALTPAQRHYLQRVLRLRSGDRFVAIDGQGQGWMVSLGEDEARIVTAIDLGQELPLVVTLLMGLPKNGMDDIVRQTTELGVGRIVPVLSERTVLHPSAQKLDRWRRIAQEATEQSERQFVPDILTPQTWTAAIQLGANSIASPRSLAYLCEARQAKRHLWSALQEDWLPENLLPEDLLPEDLLQQDLLQRQERSIVLAVGPEGGWTEPEIQQAIEAGFRTVSLGTRILRAVTAPLVALAIVGAVCEGIP